MRTRHRLPPGHNVRHWNVARSAAVALAVADGGIVGLVAALEQQLGDFALPMEYGHVKGVHDCASGAEKGINDDDEWRMVE